MTAKTARRGGRFGLAGRIALIACATAVAVTLMQWVITPSLLRAQFDAGRLQYALDAAEQLSRLSRPALQQGDLRALDAIAADMGDPLIDGAAAILSPDGEVIAASRHGLELVNALGAGNLMRRSAFGVDERRVGVYPIESGDRRLGYAVMAMKSRTLWTTWIDILLYNGLVMALVLTVFAFFLLPLARKALTPVTELERRIRRRDLKDKSRLAESSDDAVLKPLLEAIDEIHERSEGQLRRALALAYTDPVTRLPNRLRFMSRLESLVDRGNGQQVCLAVCDIDGFRKINVSMGPRLADTLLAAIADRLRTTAGRIEGASFFIGRMGADQFGIVAPGIGQAAMADFLAMAEQAIAEPVTIEGEEVRISASFGAACAPCDATSATDLIKQTEIALKEAKRSPAMRRVFFDQRLLDKARAQQKLEAEVREGVERGEFVAVFQPKVRLETGELVGAEALARWRRSDGAVVSPGVFVPIAEELGLIGQLGRSVMRDACFAAARWNRDGIRTRIAVNVSPHQFDEPDFIDSVYQALDDSGLEAELLELEITESAAVSDPDRVARIMWPLRNRGVRLAIDDFGTGHSNFASITRLPFDVFKIDQQFIRALNTDSHAPAIVEMILAMAEALGQETVAEGVETREQADFLLRRACTIGQGYYYSPPLPADEFDHFVRTWRPRPADRFAA